MIPNPEKRNKARTNHICPVTIEDLKVGLIYKAQMLNYSENGLYFEADKLLGPGEGIFIGIENSPITALSDTYECYRAKIIWRKKLTTPTFYYGYGARYTVNYNKLNLQISDFQESAGVFIKANENIAAGQIVTLGIPLRKKKKAKVKGRVVWSNLEGFGVKFLSYKKK